MCDWEFNLPLNKESLLESSDSYYVKSVCIVSQIKDQLKRTLTKQQTRCFLLKEEINESQLEGELILKGFGCHGFKSCKWIHEYYKHIFTQSASIEVADFHEHGCLKIFFNVYNIHDLNPWQWNPFNYHRKEKAREALHYDGPEAVLNHFDTYYSVIYHGEKLNIDLIQNTLKELTKPCQQLSVYLESILEDSEIAQEIQMKTLNILKMLIYLFSQITILLENKIDTKNRNDLNLAKKTGRGKGKSKKSVDDDFDIDGKRKHLNLLMRILQLPIYKLWDPPVCEEQFINLIADMCFSFLINPAIKPEKEMWQIIFYIFGILIKNYSYSMTFTVRLTQAIKDHEHLESIVPGGIKILVEEYNCISLVRELVRELTEWQSDENYQDAPGSKHCSVILIEMTALMPSLMLPEVVYLLKYLNNNSYTLRNCILSIITEVIITVLSNENITEEQIEIRNKLLNKLKVHVCDLNAHVRSKVLQQWIRLHVESAIPKDMQAEIVKKTSGRLNDKGNLVRKSAIQLMTTFLKYNPYAASLDYDFYNNELKQEIEKCNRLTSDNISNDMMEKMKNKEVEWNSMKDEIEAAIKECLEDESDDDMEVETANKSKEYVKELIMSGKYKEAFLICREFISSNEKSNEEMREMDEEKIPNFYLTFMQTIYTDLNKDAEDLFQININRLAQLTPVQVEEIKKCEENIKYLNDVVNFLDIMHNDVFPLIKNLLKSAAMSDLNESIEFLITAHQFKLKKADEGLAAMLTQMNTTEQDRKKIVIDAYRNVFLTYDGPREEKPATIVNRLIKLLKNINAADVYYLSNVIMQWADKGDLEHAIIQELWHMFIGQIANITDDDRIAVLQLLAMIARGRKTVIERNMNLVAELVFSDKCLKDPRYLIFGCEMLGIMEDDIDVNSKNPSFRVSIDDVMWQHLLEKVILIFKRKDPFCHSCITASLELIYKICQKPDVLATKLIKNILTIIKDPNGNILTDGKIDPKYLALFCHILGEIAIRQFTFLDTTVFKELKRRNNIKEETKKSAKKTKNLNISKASASRTPNVHNNTAAGEDPDESYLEGAQADDVDAEYILNVCEREIVSANLLGNFVQFLAHIVRHPHRFLSEELQACAVQALMRYMIVSSNICSEYLQLVMTVLERSKYASVKNNIFIAIADLLHRFPNVIEPWSQQIFRVVKDEDETVRMTAVSILSKLIMEDMLRVKGTIADLALCIVDKSKTIVQMTEEFFNLLSQKGNAIYNVLPDIISRLSNDKEQIDQETFKKVMTFLVQLISKDKHIESLVEKLCLRFKLSDKERVWRDIAFCLTLLTYNEKSLLRLEENFPSYKTCLEDDIVYELLISIVNKYKNSTKDEIKVITRKLDQLIRTGEVAAEETEMNQTKSVKKKPTKRGRGKKAKVQFSDSDD